MYRDSNHLFLFIRKMPNKSPTFKKLGQKSEDECDFPRNKNNRDSRTLQKI